MIPEIPQEIKEKLIAERLDIYRVRIYQAQMDVTAYRALGDAEREAVALSNIEKLTAAFHAIEGM